MPLAGGLASTTPLTLGPLESYWLRARTPLHPPPLPLGAREPRQVADANSLSRQPSDPTAEGPSAGARAQARLLCSPGRAAGTPESAAPLAAAAPRGWEGPLGTAAGRSAARAGAGGWEDAARSLTCATASTGLRQHSRCPASSPDSRDSPAPWTCRPCPRPSGTWPGLPPPVLAGLVSLCLSAKWGLWDPASVSAHRSSLRTP